MGRTPGTKSVTGGLITLDRRNVDLDALGTSPFVENRNTPQGLEVQIVAYAPSRQVVLIVEDEALVRMTAVDMIEEAGFEILEAANADEAILLLEARRDITVLFTDIEMPGSMTASGSRRPLEADGRRSKLSRHLDVASYVTVICHPAGCFYQNPTVQPRFLAPYGSSRPKSKQEAFPKLPQKIRKPLETGSTFFSFWHAAISGPGALRGPGGDGRRRYPTPARTHLAQWRIWL
jgi:hypothetical protein